MASAAQVVDPERFQATASVAKLKRGMSAFAYRWRLAYAETLWLDPVAAAEKAGFSRPAEAALKMLRKYRDLIAADKATLWSATDMTVDECRALTAQIARGIRPSTPQQVKALEMMAKFHGLLTDKVDLNIPPGRVDQVMGAALQRALPAATGAVEVQVEVVDAEVIPSLNR